jgi:lambda family phage portal protein
MQANARRAYYDSPQAKGILDSMTRSVIGTGLRLESTIKFEELGISQEDGQAIGAQIEAIFDRWASSRKASLDGSMNFYQIQALYYLTRKRDGENFNRIHYSPEKNLVNPVRLSFVDPTQIMGGFTNTGFNVRYDDGIKRNSKGEEISYKVTIQEETSPFRMRQVEIPAMGPKSKRRVMLHGFKAEYPGQKRGYSSIGHALQEFQDLQDYTSAKLDKATAESKFTGYVKPSNDAPASDPLRGITNQPPAGTSTDNLLDIASEETATVSREFTVDVCPLPESAITGKGSVLVSNLEAGEELKFLPNSSGSEDVAKFQDAIMAYVAPSCGPPLEVLKMLWGSSFSASRATLLQFQEVKEIERDDVDSDFIGPIFEAVISEAVASGELSLPGFSDPKLKSAWLSHKAVGGGVPNIDPLKMANSVEKNLGMSLTTLEREAKNLNGSDANSNISKNTKTFEVLPIAPWMKDQRVEDEPIEDGDEE